MGIRVYSYSLLWVMQDLYHQPYFTMQLNMTLEFALGDGSSLGYVGSV